MFRWWHKPWQERTTVERIKGMIVAIIIATVFIAVIVLYYFYLRPQIRGN